MPETVGYLLLFTAVGVGFILVNLTVGKLLRPAKMDAEKATIYECGEPTVGSAWVQFDLRFYVVALLFVIFDVEMAFFFPWAVVFGKANQLADPNLSDASRLALVNELTSFNPPSEGKGLRAGTSETQQATTMKSSLENGKKIAWIAFFDIAFFFGTLLVGFAYLWQRGDLNWVRSLEGQHSSAAKA